MISLLYILLNEEKYIARSINSVKSVVDEIVIVDAFSSDKTVEICTALGAVVVQEKWRHDFSHARNFGISHCKHPWILSLDADEHLEGESINLIPHAIIHNSDENNIAWEFPRKNHYPSHEPESPFFGSPFYPDFQIRLFRNVPGVFYSGKVHEGVYQSIEASSPADEDKKWWVGRLSVHIHHHMFRGDQEQFEKVKGEYYSKIEKGEFDGK